MKFAYNDSGELDDCYINIGSEKGSFFVPMSKRLISILEKYPLLYYAVEEGILCAQNGYFSGGIIAFSQILNQFNERTPDERHEVAHEILKKTPSKESYDNVVNQFKAVALTTRNKEMQNIDKKTYNAELMNRWHNLTKPLPVETDAE